MKKLIVFLILFSAIYSSAQNYKYIRLENAKYALGKTLGDDLNDLLRQGYSVRKMSATNDGYRHYLCAILSDDDQGATIESYVYVVLSRYESKYYLSGEIPSGLKKEYSSTVIDQNNLLQELSNNGFQLDFLILMVIMIITYFQKGNLEVVHMSETSHMIMEQLRWPDII